MRKLESKEDIKYMLKYPEQRAKGYTRWWWYGCNVVKDEILHELDEMKNAEIGGVELQILYPLKGDAEKEKNNFYMSPEYLELLCFTAEEAYKRNMTFDITLGSSWPFGGSFIPEEYTGSMVIPYCIDVEGPCDFSYDFTTRVYGDIVGCIMGRMEGASMLRETIVDLTEKVKEKKLFGWPWGAELNHILIPEGTYKIVVFVSSDKKQQVLKPLPGGEGPIIDHNRKEALRTFLKYAGDPIVNKIKNGYIQSFFCDSIEVFGHNWTPIVYEEFEKRRGYDLRPYIYALWGEIKGITDQVRYDFQKTMAELTVENFFQELTKWCHENKVTSRIQAHGTWGDIIQAYGAADIPEGETFSEFDKYEVNTIHRKIASSAGHIYGKAIISNESFTWLRSPRYLVTLEMMKAAVDSIFLDGMNQIVNHGYAYSSPNSGKFGLPFYASSNINHKNTWWKYYKYLGTYINRVSEVLRIGSVIIDTAIYLPQSDIWAENPISDIHMSMKLEERITTKAVDDIQKHGFSFDYVNDDVICNWESYKYKTLILIGVERIPVETARKIKEIAEAGTLVICTEELPHKACGMLAYDMNTKEICNIMEDMKKTGKIIVATNRYEQLINILRKEQIPDVTMEKYKEKIGYIHRKEDATDIYFISNISNQRLDEEIYLHGNINPFYIVDPMNITEVCCNNYIISESGIKIQLTLQPYQSVLLFTNPYWRYPELKSMEKKKRLIDISKNWELIQEEQGIKKDYEILQGWEKDEDLKYFSGECCYKRTFSINLQADRKYWIILQEVKETAEIYINDDHVKDIFMQPYETEITKYLVNGENKIEIRVRNLLINSAISPTLEESDYKDITKEWPYITGKLNQYRNSFLYHKKEREVITEPLPSGIIGKVEIWYSI